MIVTKELIERHWPLSGVAVGEDLKRASPPERQTGIIESNEGRFVYKVADERKTRESLETDLKVLDFLEGRKFGHATRLLKTRAKDGYVQSGGRLVYILEYIEGTHPEETPGTYARLGAIAAELHDVENCPYKTEFSPNAMLERDRGEILRGPLADPLCARLIDEQPDYSKLPQTIIHTDISPSNSIQRPNDEIALIDWDDAGVGATVLDLGYPLILQFVSDDLKLKRGNGEAFYRAYLSRRPLSKAETDQIFDAALFFALIYARFGDVEKRWGKVKWAVENRALLESLYRL